MPRAGRFVSMMTIRERLSIVRRQLKRGRLDAEGAHHAKRVASWLHGQVGTRLPLTEKRRRKHDEWLAFVRRVCRADW